MSDDSNLDMFLKEAIPPQVVAETPPVAEAVPEKVETPVETKEEPKGEVAAPPAAERPRDEGGRFVKQHTEDHMVPLSALLSERERRQAAEAKAAEVAKPVPDIWEDPKAYLKAELDSRETALLQKAEERARLTFFSFTEEAARSRHTDYDRVREAFAEEAQKNPAIAAQLAQAPDPGEFIYRQGKTVLELKEVGGDLSAYRQRIETEVRQRVEKELAERLAKTSNIPQSLNTEPSKGAGVTGAAWAGPTPLEDILPKR